VSLFNNLKSFVMAIPDYMFRNGFLNLLNLKRYFETVPDAKTWQDVENIFSMKNANDNSMKKILADVKSKIFDECYSWEYINSSDFLTNNDFKIEHRLYLNVRGTELYLVLWLFITGCIKYNLPYCLKYDPLASRDDVIVIYSPTRYLVNYINILQTVKKELWESKDDMQKISSKSYARLGIVCTEPLFNTPPILTGNIDGWIGYGSEPDESGVSFNLKRAEVIKKAIDKTFKAWILGHMNRNISNSGRNGMTFKTYVSRKCMEKVIGDNKAYFQTIRCDTSSYSFRQAVFSNINDQMERCLLQICKDDSKAAISIMVGNKVITINSGEIKKIINKFFAELADTDLSFIQRVRESIKAEGLNVGIVPDKFCFDEVALQKIRMAFSAQDVSKGSKRVG